MFDKLEERGKLKKQLLEPKVPVVRECKGKEYRSMETGESGIRKRKRVEWGEEEEKIIEKYGTGEYDAAEIAAHLPIRTDVDVYAHVRFLNRKRQLLGQHKLKIKSRPRGPKPQPKQTEEVKHENKSYGSALSMGDQSSSGVKSNGSSESSVEVITISSSSNTESSLDRNSSVKEESMCGSSSVSNSEKQTESSDSSKYYGPIRRRKAIDNPYLRRKISTMIRDLGKTISPPPKTSKKHKDK